MKKFITILSVLIFLFSLSQQVSWAKEKVDNTTFRITSFQRAVPSQPNVATLTVMSESNTPFIIPYIQTSTTIPISIQVPSNEEAVVKKVLFTVSEKGQVVQQSIIAKPYKTTFVGLAKGEYTLDAYALDVNGNVLNNGKFHDQVTNIGIGDIIVAIGDSTTEGYYLYSKPIPNWLSAPQDYTSSDKRTYPQPGGMAKLPTRTWLPDLSNQLSQLYGYPIFIKNAGYSGYDTSKYLATMQTKGWQMRQSALKPNKWTILLGVNDGLFKVPASQYDKNLRNIIAILKNKYHAQSDNILLAKPTYTIGVDHTKDLLPVVDEIWKEKLVAQGPDFWTFFSARYGAPYAYYRDQFHQTPAGMEQVARLWVFSFVDLDSFPVRFTFYAQSDIADFFARVQHKIETYLKK